MRKSFGWILLTAGLVTILLLACTPPESTATPVTTQIPDSSNPGMVMRNSPIQSTRVLVSETFPHQYSLVVVSSLPMGSSCSEFAGYEVIRASAGLVDLQVNQLEVDTSQHDQPVECTADLPIIDTEIPLGTASDLGIGERYTVKINGEISAEFLVRDPQGRKLKVAQAPVQRLRIDETSHEPRQYRLNLVYSQSIGSSCSDFNGFDIARPADNLFEVRLTNLEIVEENLPCTDDLPSDEITILLGTVGTNLVAGQDYEVVVNGEYSDNFTTR